ncbi:DUF4872 domain-containing protein [Streptomyces sp. NPDC021608]|uniref:DUF4872 domain-containing protein n=1 Tax=Streptomyces sp. NPDC021608 TaxID=3154903 RepID=UPI0033F78E33
MPPTDREQQAAAHRGHRLYAEAGGLWTRVAALVAAAGASGDAEHLVQAGSILHDLARIEHEAMQTLSRFQAR